MIPNRSCARRRSGQSHEPEARARGVTQRFPDPSLARRASLAWPETRPPTSPDRSDRSFRFVWSNRHNSTDKTEESVLAARGESGFVSAPG